MEPSIIENESKKCPVCGTKLPEDAPRGMCPRCLMAGVAAATETGPVPGDASVRAPDRERVAGCFPQLEIVELVGVGGMGAVFKARQKHLERWVALKVMSEKLVENPAFVERFNREARVLAKLNHPNIVTLHDFGQAGPFCYLLMEYVDGVNLRQAMRAGRFTAAEALGLVPKICEALQFAHDEGVLHRDIKPENILLDGRGRVKIADFGVAKLLDRADGKEMTLTASGASMGTPSYMAPEQIEAPSSVDHRADIFSLGVVLYEMLTGELPLGRFAAPSSKTPVDGRVDVIVMRALEKERDRRQQSADEVRTEVESLSQGDLGTKNPVPPSLPAGGSGGGGGREAGKSGSAGRTWNSKSVLAAVCTGLSLVIAVAAAVSFVFWQEYVRPNGRETAQRLLLLVGIPAVLLAGIPAAAGLGLGLMALREIRHRAGVFFGRGLAWIAVLAWPVVLILLVSTVGFLRAELRPARGSEAGSVSNREGIRYAETLAGEIRRVDTPAPTVPSAGDIERLRIRLELAEQKLTEALVRRQNGQAGEEEVARLQRDVAVLKAEIAGDRVAAAQAKVAFAEWYVSHVRRRVDVGVAAPSELLESESDLRLRRIDLEEALAAAISKPSSPPSPAAPSSAP